MEENKGRDNMAKLKNKQHEEFCHLYLTKLNGKMYNATASAIKSGYSKKTARSMGSRLLTRVDIQRRIDELKSARLRRIDLDADYVATHLMKIVEDDITNYVDVKETKAGTVIKVKDLDNIDTFNIQEIGINNNGGLKLKTHDKIKALGMLKDILEDAKGDNNDIEQVIDNFKPALSMIQKALEGDENE